MRVYIANTESGQRFTCNKRKLLVEGEQDAGEWWVDEVHMGEYARDGEGNITFMDGSGTDVHTFNAEDEDAWKEFARKVLL